MNDEKRDIFPSTALRPKSILTHTVIALNDACIHIIIWLNKSGGNEKVFTSSKIQTKRSTVGSAEEPELEKITF